MFKALPKILSELGLLFLFSCLPRPTDAFLKEGRIIPVVFNQNCQLRELPLCRDKDFACVKSDFLEFEILVIPKFLIRLGVFKFIRHDP